MFKKLTNIILSLLITCTCCTGVQVNAEIGDIIRAGITVFII